MLTGSGEQYWQRKKYQTSRCKALLDSSKFTEQELEELDVEFPYGSGRTDPKIYYRKISNMTRGKQRSELVDLRKYPRYGI